MKKIVAFVALAAAASHAAYPERWVFWNQHIETPEQCAAFSNVVDQAAACGCTAFWRTSRRW